MAFFAQLLGILLIWWVTSWMIDGSRTHPESRKLTLALLAYGLVCLWVSIQAAPSMPSFLIDPAWQNASKILAASFGGHLSLDPGATLVGLMHLFFYATVFWLTFQLTRRHEQAWTAINALSWMGCAYALYGILVYASGNKWILLLPKWTYMDSLTSTFVNRNSYATFAGLTLLCALASWLRHFKPFFELNYPFRSKVVLIIEEMVAKAGLKTFAVLTIAIALLLTASRGGVSASAIGLIVLGLLYFRKRRMDLKQWGMLTIASLISATIIFSASGNHLAKRLPNEQIDSSFDVRYEIYQTTWDAMMISPLKGTGFGTFEDVFPAFRAADTGVLTHWDKAHNTYLENALELGLPAALLLNVAIALVAFQCLRGAINRKRERLLPALGVAATILVGLHSLVDFSLQIPAVTILYACIMGVAVGQSWSQGKRTRS